MRIKIVQAYLSLYICIDRDKYLSVYKIKKTACTHLAMHLYKCRATGASTSDFPTATNRQRQRPKTNRFEE